jgi:hypothetical protein
MMPLGANRGQHDRRGFILGLGVFAALAGFAVSPALADGKRVALVIGNSTYRNVPTLPNPAMTELISPRR